MTRCELGGYLGNVWSISAVGGCAPSQTRKSEELRISQKWREPVQRLDSSGKVRVMAVVRNTRLRFAILGPVLVVAACGGGASLSSPTVTSNGNAAILDWSGFGAPTVEAIDGNAVEDSGSAALEPGRHTVRVYDERGQSVLLGSPIVYLGKTFEFFAESGHTYRVRHERAYGYGTASDFIWIEDAASGAIIDGRKPPGSIPDANSANYAGRSRSRSAAAYHVLSYAAHCGAASAQYDLALFHLAGIEPVEEPDPALAYAWYARAARAGHREAETVRRRLWEDLSAEQRARAASLPAPASAVSCN